MNGETRTYEIITKEGTFRIDIPEMWKVTYGPVIGAKGDLYGAMTFRVWESDKQQRALFANVTGFRDMSLVTRQKAARKYGSETWLPDSDDYSPEEYEKAWVNMDEISQVPLVTGESLSVFNAVPKHLAGMRTRKDKEF